MKLPKYANAEMDLTIEKDADMPIIAGICSALGNETRLQILKVMQCGRTRTVPELVKLLKIPKTTLLHHLYKLEEYNLITIQYKSSTSGTARMIARDMRSVKISFYYNQNEIPSQQTSITESVGVGHYADFVGDSFDFATNANYFRMISESVFMPERTQAQLVSASNGIITYYMNNKVAKYHSVNEIQLSLEICSEAPYFDNDYKSDITFWINNQEIATYTSDGDFGDRKGLLNPEWWPSVNTQYGRLVTVTVNDKGVYLNNQKISSCVKLKDLDLAKGNKIILAIGNKDTATNRGGFNIFGKEFGDYPQDICLKFTYDNLPSEK